MSSILPLDRCLRTDWMDSAYSNSCQFWAFFQARHRYAASRAQACSHNLHHIAFIASISWGQYFAMKVWRRTLASASSRFESSCHSKTNCASLCSRQSHRPCSPSWNCSLPSAQRSWSGQMPYWMLHCSAQCLVYPHLIGTWGSFSEYQVLDSLFSLWLGILMARMSRVS